MCPARHCIIYLPASVQLTTDPFLPSPPFNPSHRSLLHLVNDSLPTPFIIPILPSREKPRAAAISLSIWCKHLENSAAIINRFVSEVNLALRCAKTMKNESLTVEIEKIIPDEEMVSQLIVPDVLELVPVMTQSQTDSVLQTQQQLHCCLSRHSLHRSAIHLRRW